MTSSWPITFQATTCIKQWRPISLYKTSNGSIECFHQNAFEVMVCHISSRSWKVSRSTLRSEKMAPIQWTTFSNAFSSSNSCISNKFNECVTEVPIHNSSLVQGMSWRQTATSHSIIDSSLTYMCVTGPQRVKQGYWTIFSAKILVIG